MKLIYKTSHFVTTQLKIADCHEKSKRKFFVKEVNYDKEST